MTSGSHSTTPASGARQWKRAAVALVAGWHAICVILGNMGCFVTWEMPILDVNEPPVVRAWLHEDGDVVSYAADLPDFFIAASDPDSDAPLLFYWQVDNTRLFDVSWVAQPGEGDAPDIWESDVTVPWAEEFDGAELSVQIVDAGGARTRAAWTLEVL